MSTQPYRPETLHYNEYGYLPCADRLVSWVIPVGDDVQKRFTIDIHDHMNTLGLRVKDWDSTKILLWVPLKSLEELNRYIKGSLSIMVNPERP